MISRRETRISEHVAARVRELRQERGWPMTRLSAELHFLGFEMSAAVINTLENGVTAQHGYGPRVRSVTVDELAALAEVFGVTPRSLLP